MASKDRRSFFKDKVKRESWETFEWDGHKFKALIKIDGVLTKRRQQAAKRKDPRFKQIFSKDMIVCVLERQVAMDKANTDEERSAIEVKFAEKIGDKMGPDILVSSAALLSDPELTIKDIADHVKVFLTPDDNGDPNVPEDIKELLEEELLPDPLVDAIRAKIKELNDKGQTVLTDGGRKNLSGSSDGGTESGPANPPSGTDPPIS